MSSKEIEQLQKRKRKAQDQGDIAEEAKLCNAIGELYSQNGNYKRALQYHQQEISLSEAAGDQIGTAVAHRKVGECFCELSSYQDAVHHQKQHLRMSRCLGDLAEEQRALATLGRTYFVYSQSEEEKGKPNATDFLIKAEKNYIDSLDVCNKLVSLVSDMEILEMRSRLYLNLGLVYETRMELQSARLSMEKALNILRELGDSATLAQCSYDLGSLHLRDHRPRVALTCFQEALDMAREQRNNKLEATSLQEMAQAHLRLDNFQAAKSCLKKALLLNQLQAEKELAEKQLHIIRKVLQCSSEVEDMTNPEMKLKLYERLGDLCCSLKAYPAAISFYGQQLDLAENQDRQPARLSPIYISLARTHIDCGQFSQAEAYYKKELEYCCSTPIEKCDTWTSIAKMHVQAGNASETVMEAYHEAASFAEESGNLKHQMDVYKSILKYCRSQDDDLDSELSQWEGKLAHLLEAHPELANSGERGGGEDSGGSDEEDSQGLENYQDLSDVPSSLPSEDPDDEEEEGQEEEVASHPPPSSSGSVRQPPVTRSATGVVARKKKAKLLKRNEKGETLLHVAAIQGNLSMVKKLIREGADVNVRDYCGWIPLHEACNYGHTEVVAVLLDGNSNIDDPGGPGCNGVTPLIDAAYNGHVDVVQLLVQRGANIMLKDQHGNTALDMVLERLASKAESGQSYELEEEHTAIHELLSREMKKLGYEPPPPHTACSRRRSNEEGSAARGKRSDARRQARQKQAQKVLGLSSSVSQSARGSSRACTSSSILSSLSVRTKPPRERYSSNLLYSSSSSSEEEDNVNTITSKPRSSTTNHHQTLSSTRSNPFENFTVGKRSSAGIIGEHQSIRSEYQRERSKKRLPMSATVAIAGNWSRFNPLGQVEGNSMPALIPENEEGEEGRGSSRDNDGDLPLIDNWLVDDMSSTRNKDQPPAKRRKHQLSSGTSRKEIKSFLEGNTSTSSAMPSQGRGGRKRPLQQKNQMAAQLPKKRSPSRSVAVSSSGRQCTNGEEQNSNKKRKTILVDDSSSSDSDERFLDSVIITEDDSMMDSDCTTSTLTSTKSSRLHTRAPLNSTNPTASSSSLRGEGSCTTNTPQSRYSRGPSRSSSERQSSLFPHQSASSSSHHPHIATQCSGNSRIDSTTSFNRRQFQTTPPSLLEYTKAATSNIAPNISSDMPPLFRVRVKIESKSYLIPCPRKGPNGLDTTIQWLISQASERHYAQQGLGARPRLSLTTSDGAILCPTDLVSHVLSPDEELVGVVEGWVEETLEESYLAVCKKEQMEPYPKALQFFQTHSSSSSIASLDFSDLQLTADISRPIFKALSSINGGHQLHTLTSVILKGNQLGDAAMVDLTSALSRVSTLSELNLSKTGITAQGVESLARFSPTQSSTAATADSSSPPWSGLRTLNLSSNKLGVACGRGLALLLGHCSGLQELSLASCRLGPGTFDKDTGLCDILKGLLDLIELNLSLNPLGPEGVSSLLLSLPPQLSRLNLRETCRKNRPITEAMDGDCATTCMSELPMDEYWLEYLDLSHCGINDSGLPTLIGWLERCGELKELKLAGSSITASGVDPLCGYISTSCSLRSLDLSGAVRLGNDGAVKILTACHTCGLFNNIGINEEKNDRGSRVCLKGCGLETPLPVELVELLKSAMKDSQEDNAVDLSGNKINDSDKSKIFDE